MKPRTLLSLCAVLVALAATPAHALSYPTHPVTILVPFGAGGGSDLLARLVAQRLEQRLHQPFVIENRPGAATTIAALAAVRSTPDGTTLMQATSSTMAINVTMYKKLAYEPLKDLVPVALLSSSPFFLVVKPTFPAKSVKELIELAKKNPNGLNYGSGGPGSMHHLSTELMLNLTGTKMTHVPYKGTPPAMNDLLGGSIQVLFGDSTTLLPAIRAGTVRALAVSTATRSEAAPEIPTMAEAGVAGFESASWQMLVAPGGTPPEVISLLNREVRAIFSDPSVTKELSHRGVGPQLTGSPEQLRKFVQDEIARWADIVRRAGVAGRL
ncbi:MAG: tripartite tricarboxylate transporter substrate binding protein [Xanthobacteraceae bacterium]